ncbi:hypothetical protein ALO_15837 [Acetonema longum DSM 6540]|uniref:Uncharacterized protein n=1 Tax=Acetonema longum DSM 6540 TaxID=1009370 RepID=F7NM41_9FIRM|nr:hypothetical protein ALO_15837 [Acetonema longum DSM 6540]
MESNKIFGSEDRPVSSVKMLSKTIFLPLVPFTANNTDTDPCFDNSKAGALYGYINVAGGF